MTFRYSPEARQDLINIWLFISADDIDTADQVSETIAKTYLRIAENPNIGHNRNDLAESLRAFPVKRSSWRSVFVIFFRAKSDCIEIVRILEGHRDIRLEMFE